MYKILVAEDDPFYLKVYEMKLRTEGFELKSVTNGEEVVEAAKAFLPDIILLDIIMPGMDGLAALKKLKNTRETKNIPVIITSNLGQQEEITKGMELGAVDYIIKSDVTINDIIDTVRRFLSEEHN